MGRQRIRRRVEYARLLLSHSVRAARSLLGIALTITGASVIGMIVAAIGAAFWIVAAIISAFLAIALLWASYALWDELEHRIAGLRAEVGAKQEEINAKQGEIDAITDRIENDPIRELESCLREGERLRDEPLPAKPEPHEIDAFVKAGRDRRDRAMAWAERTLERLDEACPASCEEFRHPGPRRLPDPLTPETCANVLPARLDALRSIIGRQPRRA
jgi:phosphate/sulfate permease